MDRLKGVAVATGRVAAGLAAVVVIVGLWVVAVVARAIWGMVVDEEGRYPWEH